MDEDVTRYIISPQELVEYFDNRLIVTKEEYEEYLIIKDLYNTKVINM